MRIKTHGKRHGTTNGFGTTPPKRSLGETMRGIARRVRHPRGYESKHTERIQPQTANGQHSICLCLNELRRIHSPFQSFITRFKSHPKKTALGQSAKEMGVKGLPKRNAGMSERQIDRQSDLSGSSEKMRKRVEKC